MRASAISRIYNNLKVPPSLEYFFFLKTQRTLRDLHRYLTVDYTHETEQLTTNIRQCPKHIQMNFLYLKFRIKMNNRPAH